MVGGAVVQIGSSEARLPLWMIFSVLAAFFWATEEPPRKGSAPVARDAAWRKVRLFMDAAFVRRVRTER
ncbi:hypothetical protein RSO01_79580 [Reyranella soli]|uniref:Uncharacterized protein n=1 Tax=Reyranella soli TaxID=1230389 RepID=A0A512NPE9_9HYPH|nr:hypothetical protein RSO01_79580 [Reyranella soli]